jgi:diguanylate cyclase (GGDEF)-like protein
LPARQGGEEFVVLFEGVDTEQARAVGERMRHAVAAHTFAHDGSELTITVSIGIALLQSQDVSFDALMTRADLALYAAKANGRNRVEIAMST